MNQSVKILSYNEEIMVTLFNPGYYDEKLWYNQLRHLGYDETGTIFNIETYKPVILSTKYAKYRDMMSAKVYLPPFAQGDNPIRVDQLIIANECNVNFRYSFSGGSKSKYQVWHKDGNWRNNALYNLELVDRATFNILLNEAHEKMRRNTTDEFPPRGVHSRIDLSTGKIIRTDISCYDEIQRNKTQRP